MVDIKFLDDKLAESVVRQHERGLRRYFPITAKSRRGWKWLYEAYHIIYGVKPKDNGQVGYAILHQALDKYVERFDGKLWVRTIYKVDEI